MQRLLRELDDLDAAVTRPRTHRRGELPRRLAAAGVAMLLVVMIGGVFAHKQFGLTIGADGIAVAQPLGRPPEVGDRDGHYAFMMVQDASDSPVAYDPCRPIEYVVNDAARPAGAEDVLAEAIAEISAATGLVFRAVGTTRDEPRSAGSLRAPLRREPVHIAWTTPSAVPELDGRVAGIGGSTARKDEYSGTQYYVTGMVALDAPQLGDVLARPGGEAQVRAIVIHELSHLVGLDHVDDPGELMYADNVGRLDLGPGDRRGLALVGAGRCIH